MCIASMLYHFYRFSTLSILANLLNSFSLSNDPQHLSVQRRAQQTQYQTLFPVDTNTSQFQSGADDQGVRHKYCPWGPCHEPSPWYWLSEEFSASKVSLQKPRHSSRALYLHWLKQQRAHKCPNNTAGQTRARERSVLKHRKVKCNNKPR